MGIGSFIRSLLGGQSARPMARDAFAQEVADRVRRAIPEAGVEVADDLHLRVRQGEDDERSVYLDNAYHMYVQADPADREEVLVRFVASYADAGSIGDATRDAIVPVVKDRQWLEEVRISLAQRGKMGEEPEIVHEALTDELTIVYAIDTPNNIAYLTRSQLQELELDRSELRKLAVRNLRGLLPGIEVHRGPLMSMVTADGNYEASLLLFDDLWERERERLVGDPVVAVPARDLLVFADSTKPEGVAELRLLAAKMRAEAAYSLTDALFVWRDGQLQRLVEEPAAG